SPEDFYYIGDTIAQKDGVLTIINKHKFIVHSYKFTVFTPNKKMATTLLSFHNRNYFVGIINLHLPFRRTTDIPKEFEIIAQEIKNYPKDLPWIICGDFNYSILQGNKNIN